MDNCILYFPIHTLQRSNLPYQKRTDRFFICAIPFQYSHLHNLTLAGDNNDILDHYIDFSSVKAVRSTSRCNRRDDNDAPSWASCTVIFFKET